MIKEDAVKVLNLIMDAFPEAEFSIYNDETGENILYVEYEDEVAKFEIFFEDINYHSCYYSVEDCDEGDCYQLTIVGYDEKTIIKAIKENAQNVKNYIQKQVF